jgi:hypothetical protein
VVVLELADAELAIDRAIGRRMDPESGRVFHLKFAPPPGDDPGLLERLAPVRSSSNDSEQIQTRMKVHLETAPELHAWFCHFRKLVHSVDSAVPIGELTERVLAITKTIEDCQIASQQCRAAADAAQQARAGAEAAARSAKAASVAAAAAARELLLAKRAELEAAQLLRKAPEVVKGSKGSKSKEDPAQVQARAAEADAAATLLAMEAAARCADHLKVGTVAKDEAQEHADVARTCAEAAATAVAQAQRSKHDAERSAHAQAAAAEAAQAACEAAAAAESAAMRAADAARLARGAVADAQVRVQKVQDNPGEDTSSILEDYTSVPTAEAPAVRGSEAAVLHKEHMAPEVATYLDNLWHQTEAAYIQDVKSAFAGIRRLRQEVVVHLSAARARFIEFLRRGDAKQVELTKFVLQYNGADLDMLRVPEVKAEVALQADELRDLLWGICDTKQAENTKLFGTLTCEVFAADTASALGGQFVSILQSEVDRFLAAVSFAKDYAALSFGMDAPEADHEVCNISAAPSASLAPFLDAKPVAQFPAWLAGSGAAPFVLQAAKVVLALIMFHEQGCRQGGDKPEPGKKGAKDKKGKAPLEPETLPVEGGMLDAVRKVLMPMLERERHILLARVRAVVQRSAAHAADVTEVVKRTNERMLSAIKESYKVECEVVATVTQIIKDAIDAAEKLSHDLRIQENVIVVDTSAMLIPKPAPKVPRPPRDGSKEAGLLNTRQLSSLVNSIQSVCQCEFFATRQMACLLQKLAAAHGQASFPPPWARATFTQMQGALTLFDPHQSSYIDWMHVVTSLLLQSFPGITCALPAAFAAAASALVHADADGDGLLTEDEWLGSTLWFQAPRMHPGCTEDLEADFALMSGEPSTVAFDEATELKRLLWSMFSKVRCVIRIILLTMHLLSKPPHPPHKMAWMPF